MSPSTMSPSTGVSNGTDGPKDPEWLASLSPENAACIRRLLSSPAPPSFNHVPKRKQAAVAVILYESNTSPTELRAIMSTRALHLRSHPGQASLPGGKVDSADSSLVETALRESVEEIALATSEAVWLHTGYPFLSKMGLIVHPVVFFLKNGAELFPRLRASPCEVSDIWSTPLSVFLSSITSSGQLSDPKNIDKHRPPQEAFRTYTDIPWLGGNYRLHRFRSSHQLIKGLTADVLISVAQKAYAVKAKYRVKAEGQKTWEQMVEAVIQRYNKEQGRIERRWGDGESGDVQGSSEAYETFIGFDDEGDGVLVVEEALDT
ncbi:related to PCD1 - peroxisomal nudix pyrophosphatase [Ustilago sp. UG-2017b]|nr:related to PCD1 - peroxisomal nudix pyrophosphatase [Ustilago sp. UG-2017b]